MKKVVSILILACYWTLPVQSQRFESGFKASGCLSQIDGDDILGFHKPGYEVGVYTSARLSPTTALELGINYSLRGSRYGKNDPVPVSFDLHYIDIPILFVLKDWMQTENDQEFYRMSFFGGFSIGRLISSSSLSGLDKEFNKTDVSWILGTAYNWSPSWAATGKYTRSLSSLYNYSKNGNEIRMISYFISLGLRYTF